LRDRVDAKLNEEENAKAAATGGRAVAAVVTAGN